MKISVGESRKQFKPIEVSLILESEEELLSLRAFFGGASVPQCIRNSDFPNASVDFAADLCNKMSHNLDVFVSRYGLDKYGILSAKQNEFT